MRKLLKDELLQLRRSVPMTQKLDCTEVVLENVDLSGYDLRNIDFTWSDFKNVSFERSNLEQTSFLNAYFSNCTLEGACLKNVDLGGTNLRFCNLCNVNAKGANFYFANLEGALLENIQYDDTTKYFKLRCPETGAFVGYKKCFNYRVVQLLIPADAKRTSATNDACRCNKAKVLSIKSFDSRESFSEARSLVNENFVYRVGAYVYVDNFDENRWNDSTTGIHFWMSRAEALAY